MNDGDIQLLSLRKVLGINQGGVNDSVMWPRLQSPSGKGPGCLGIPDLASLAPGARPPLSFPLCLPDRRPADEGLLSLCVSCTGLSPPLCSAAPSACSVPLSWLLTHSPPVLKFQPGCPLARPGSPGQTCHSLFAMPKTAHTRPSSALVAARMIAVGPRYRRGVLPLAEWVYSLCVQCLGRQAQGGCGDPRGPP